MSAIAVVAGLAGVAGLALSVVGILKTALTIADANARIRESEEAEREKIARRHEMQAREEARRCQLPIGV